MKILPSELWKKLLSRMVKKVPSESMKKLLSELMKKVLAIYTNRYGKHYEYGAGNVARRSVTNPRQDKKSNGQRYNKKKNQAGNKYF